MLTITIKEAADIKGCTVQNLQKQALNGDIETITELTRNNRKRYMIPLSELTETEQMKYYQMHDMPLPKELVKSNKNKKTVKRSTDIEDYNADQRDEMAFWHGIIAQWQDYCIGKASKVGATREFVELMRKKYPDIKISSDILYRRQRAEKDSGICGQADTRGGHNKGSSVIEDNIWEAFLYFYLDENKPPVSKCYELTEEWTNKTYPELLPLPSVRTFYRHIDTDIKTSLKVLGREGEKAFHDRCTPFIRRFYNNMESNEWWIADTHTFDIMSLDNSGTAHRLYLMAFMDARSGIITGYHITDKPSSQGTLIALRNGIIRYGIPVNIYVDNGREFLTHDVGGLGHRQKKSQKEEFNAPPVFERLGIKMTNATVKNAQAKIIERRFLDIKNGLSRLFDTFTGGTVVERPERLKRVLKGKQGTVPTDKELIEIVKELIDNYFNMEIYNGAVQRDKGKIKQQVYEDNLKVRRVASENDLNLMLMRSSKKYKVGRRGVHIDIAGERIDYWNNEFIDNYLGKEVYYRYDPDDLSYIRVYDLDDRYIMTVPADNEAVLEYGASQSDIKTALRKTHSHAKEVKQELKEIKNLYGGKTALEIAIEKAHDNQNIKIVKSNPIITIQRADEKVLEQAVGAEVDINNIVSYDRMIENLENRDEDL